MRGTSYKLALADDTYGATQVNYENIINIMKNNIVLDRGWFYWAIRIIGFILILSISNLNLIVKVICSIAFCIYNLFKYKSIVFEDLFFTERYNF